MQIMRHTEVKICAQGPQLVSGRVRIQTQVAYTWAHAVNY